MCVYEKINCTISFQYVLLYILVLFTFSSLSIRGCELYSVQLVTHLREEIKRVLEENRRERTFVNCSCQKNKK